MHSLVLRIHATTSIHYTEYRPAKEDVTVPRVEGSPVLVGKLDKLLPLEHIRLQQNN